MVPFHKAYLPNTVAEAIQEVLKSGWTTTGPKTAELEKNFREFLDGGEDLKVLITNSATSAAELLFSQMETHREKVIFPAITFSSIPMAALKAGFEIVLCDVDEKTLNMNPEHLATLLDDNVAAVMVTHHAGYPADLAALKSLCDEWDVYLYEDCAHCPTSKYYGHNTGDGTYSDAAIFSFYATKTIGAGEGGALVTRHNHIYEPAQKMRLHGFDKGAFDRYTNPRAAWDYDVVVEGHKANLTDIHAAIALEQLKYQHLYQAERVGIAVAYNRRLSNLPIELPYSDLREQVMASRHLYQIRLPEGADRTQFILNMRDNGVMCSVHFKPLHLFTFWERNVRYDNLPVAESVYPRLVSLPIWPGMTEVEIGQVIRAVDTSLLKLGVQA